MAESQSYADKFAATQKAVREHMAAMDRPDPSAAKVLDRLAEKPSREAGRN